MKTEQQRKVAVAFSNCYKVEDRLTGAKELLQEPLSLIGEEQHEAVKHIEAALYLIQDIEEKLQYVKAAADRLAEMKANNI